MLLLDSIPYSFPTQDHMSLLEFDLVARDQWKQPVGFVCRNGKHWNELQRPLSLSFITNHAPITRKPLCQRLSLTFAKCQSFSCRLCNISVTLTRCRASLVDRSSDIPCAPGPQMHTCTNRVCPDNDELQKTYSLYVSLYDAVKWFCRESIKTI